MVPTRRRFIRIAAAFAGLAALPAERGYAAPACIAGAASRSAPIARSSCITPKPNGPSELIAACIAEARRLEVRLQPLSARQRASPTQPRRRSR